jgi:hypothetical protein
MHYSTHDIRKQDKPTGSPSPRKKYTNTSKHGIPYISAKIKYQNAPLDKK